MSGYIVSEPYVDKDWSGKGNVVYYCDIAIDHMINPSCLPILPSEDIMKEIPDFDWLGGHSGRLLPPESAARLETMWNTFLLQHSSMFRLRANKQEVDLDDYRENTMERISLTIGEDGKVHGETSYRDITYSGDTVGDTIKHLLEQLKTKGKGEVEYKVEFDYANEEMFPLYCNAVDMAFAKFKGQTDRLGKQDIINAIMSLTQKDGESFMDFIMRVDGNEIGRRVMMANLEDELNFYRYEELKAEDLPVFNEKLKAWRYLDNGIDNTIEVFTEE